MVEAKQHGEHGWNHHQIADELNITPPARNNSSHVETVEATGSVRWCSAVPVASTTDAESPHDLGFAGHALFADGAILEVLGYVGLVLSIPGVLFEVGLGLLLLVRGFLTM